MKKIIFYLAACFAIVLVNGCELAKVDNYKVPDASIYGGIYDIETGALVEQDIIRGTQIEYVEDKYDNPQTQYLVVQNDGTYRNDLMFSNTYTIRPVRGNFTEVPKMGVDVKGETKVDFKVQPYIRIKNAKIEKVGNKIVATFNLDQTVENKVSRIGLFAHPEKNVGDPLNIVSAQMTIDSVTNETMQYRLEIDLDANKDKLKAGNEYFFRVGALINAPEAKFNYAPAVRIGL